MAEDILQHSPLTSHSKQDQSTKEVSPPLKPFLTPSLPSCSRCDYRYSITNLERICCSPFSPIAAQRQCVSFSFPSRPGAPFSTARNSLRHRPASSRRDSPIGSRSRPRALGLAGSARNQAGRRKSSSTVTTRSSASHTRNGVSRACRRCRRGEGKSSRVSIALIKRLESRSLTRDA